MMTATRTLEVDVSAACIPIIAASMTNATRRDEVPVLHHHDGQVSIDTVFLNVDAEREYFAACEFKTGLNAELEAQAMRWIGYADFITIGYPAVSQIKPSTLNRIGRLDHAGIGRVILVSGGAAWANRPQLLQTDPVLRGVLEAAYLAHDGSLDAPSGSAGASRMTADRTRWEAIRRYLVHSQELAESGNMIRRNVEGERRTTDAQIRKAIDTGDLMGVRYFTTDGISYYGAKK